MLLVVDANVLVAAMLKDGQTRHLLIFRTHRFVIPEFIFEETKEHLDELSERTGVSSEKLWQTLQELVTQAKITAIKIEEFEDKLQEANVITPDIKDIQYLALALKKDCAIWSNDKELNEQKKVRIITTEELSRNPTF